MTENSINKSDAIREAFEEWFDSQGLWGAMPNKKDKKPDGEYEDYLAEREWKKWQENHNG